MHKYANNPESLLEVLKISNYRLMHRIQIIYNYYDLLRTKIKVGLEFN